ncbi:MAG: GntR family transcriptional regulator [Lachnospiraceae bacterium]|nr:GntR family transcriptional regulator [Lachnospiraceae bacterium]
MLLKLDFASQTPIYQQIRNQIVLSVAEGRLPPGQRIPSMRALADESGINMMTVNKAYQLLRQEGYLQIDRRSGARITLPSGLSENALSALSVSASKEALRQLEPKLALLISEARLHGISQDAFLDLCRRIYQRQEEV